MSELKTEQLVYMQDETYNPIHYKGVIVKQPFFEGKGNHSVAQLEEICEQFKEYCHQQAIIKQNCMKHIVEFKEKQLLEQKHTAPSVKRTNTYFKMKQLKITIAGEVKTFDLPENGEYKCEVTETYEPKAGDCVMIRPTDHSILYWCKLSSVTTTTADFNIAVDSRLEIYENDFFHIKSKHIYTKITPKELKAKYAEAGFDWDYESDTIKPIKWVPKEGDEVWFLNVYMEADNFIFGVTGDFEKCLLDKGLIFQTEEECQKFADHCWEFINNK